MVMRKAILYKSRRVHSGAYKMDKKIAGGMV
jgi:hypothetical protein